MHALLEGLTPTRVSFPLLPSGQKAPSEALVPVRFLHIRECCIEEQEARLSHAHNLDPVLPWHRRPHTQMFHTVFVYPAVEVPEDGRSPWIQRTVGCDSVQAS